jgi:hypothetical protein
MTKIQNWTRLPSTGYIRPELMSKAGPEQVEGVVRSDLTAARFSVSQGYL